MLTLKSGLLQVPWLRPYDEPWPNRIVPRPFVRQATPEELAPIAALAIAQTSRRDDAKTPEAAPSRWLAAHAQPTRQAFPTGQLALFVHRCVAAFRTQRTARDRFNPPKRLPTMPKRG